MPQTSPLINKNITTEKTHKYLYTSMVSHQGTPVSFAMDKENGKIYYSVLDMSNTEQNAKLTDGLDQNNDKNYWSKVIFDENGQAMPTMLNFPTEIMQVGFAVVPNFQIDKYDDNNNKVILKFDADEKPLDIDGKELSVQAIKDKTNFYYSSTARLGAKEPFQTLSDGKYIYVFRQSIAENDSNNENPAIVNNTLLVDRFILSGTVLKLSREIRYQRSRHKTEPDSRKDTLAAVDVEGIPFYEPTRELVFANNLSNGNFSVLLIPGADSEEQRWQIFTTDAITKKVNSFNIRFDYSIIFDTSDSHKVIEEFIQKYELDTSLISDVQEQINAEPKSDEKIATELLGKTKYDKDIIPEDALAEMVYTIRTGVIKDDFVLASSSELPLIEYKADGKSIKQDYLKDGVLEDKYAFVHGSSNDLLKANSSLFKPEHGLSSCYYYQQELGPDGKPMKNKASVMLAMGIEDKSSNKYIGILNFAVASSGQVSRLTIDEINMPDINVQALDENPYSSLKDIPTDNKDKVAWQAPQKMSLLDIDPNGLSTSGGVLKFGYTSAEIGKSQGYSDAVLATEPYLYDDSLGRVNLYFKGKEENFFVLYFNPTGSKGIVVTPPSPPLILKSRLDRDMNINVTAEVGDNKNTCTLSMKSNSETVETWNQLPKQFAQVARILNGNGELPIGTLNPLGLADDPRAAYKKTESQKLIRIRTTVDNNLIIKDQKSAVDLIGQNLEEKKDFPLNDLSNYLNQNIKFKIAQKEFSLKRYLSLRADVFYKSYLSGMANDPKDVDKLWKYLNTKKLIKKVTGKKDLGQLTIQSLKETAASLSALLTDQEIDKLSLELLKEGNEADKKARRARLKQSLITLIIDVAKVRIVTFKIQDDNPQAVDRLEAGLEVTVQYDYDKNFTCTPANLEGTSASKWEHARSYLFNASVQNNENTVSEISSTFNHKYDINNTIGQWEDWDASLALKLTPKSKTNGVALYSTDADKIEALRPSKKGLSLEAWIKPTKDINNTASIVAFKKGDQSYSLGLQKEGTAKYKCIATLGDKKYTSKNSFPFLNDGKEQWRHLAFTHKKYWGYKIGKDDYINCGNDSSLQLTGEFSLEILVKIDQPGSLLTKQGEYNLSINKDKEISFNWGEKDCLVEWVIMDDKPTPAQQKDKKNYKKIDNSTWEKKNSPDKLDSMGQFYKITIIRSRNKPDTEPSKEDYPISSDQDDSGNSSKKWYKDKSSDEMIEGMAEKQDQMESSMKFSQSNMFGNSFGNVDDESDYNPTYYHTLIITKEDNTSKEWTSGSPIKIEDIEAFKDFKLGDSSFEGTFAGVHVWNRALSKSEAKAFSLSDTKGGMIAHWRMAEGKGKYLYDGVGENHGLTVGGKWTDSPRSNQPGQFQFYVDGSPEGNETAPNSAKIGVEQFCIGGIKTDDSKFTNHFKGMLEEVRIWNVPRTNEQITDNAFGRLKGEWEQLLANYTFDKPLNLTDNKIQDSSVNSIQLTVHNPDMLKEVLSTAPIATEIPQVRSALTGVLTEYNGYIHSRPGIVEYGDVQKNDDGTINGILKRCYSFIDSHGEWHRMTGFKVGNLVSQWFSQAQFAPQVLGFLEGPPPVPAENFPLGSDADIRTYAYTLNNSIHFNQAEEVTYNYSTQKEAGWNVAVESEMDLGLGFDVLVAPLGFGMSFKAKVGLATASNWETSGKRSQSFERGTSVNTQRGFSATLAGFDNGKTKKERYYKLDNTGYALVKSKTADVYLLRLAHNNALVSIFWQPNPDIPEDVNILTFPINPLYVKQGTLDGKFAETTDDHYPQAHGAYGQYSYFKPREAYKLKKQIDREKMELKAYFEDSFDVAKTSSHFNAAAATTGVAQLAAFIPGQGLLTSGFNQLAGQLATQVGYNNTQLKDDLAKMGSQRNLINTYVWTIEGGFYAESTEVAETQQETYSNETSLSLSGGLGMSLKADAAVALEQKTLFSSGSSFSLTKSKTKESSTSFGMDVNVDIPTSVRYQYGGTDGRSLIGGIISPGMVDAYRFMSFYLEPKGKNFVDLFTKVIDQKWLDENPSPNAQALRQARGNIDKAKPCWRIMHRVTYVSRVLPEFQPEAPPSLEKTIRVSGMESNYMLIKRFEPYVGNIKDTGTFFNKIEEIIDTQLPEFKAYKSQIKQYLALYFNMDQV